MEIHEPTNKTEYHTLGIGLDDILTLYKGKSITVTFKRDDKSDLQISVFCGTPKNRDLRNVVYTPHRYGKPTLRERIRFLFKGEF